MERKAEEQNKIKRTFGNKKKTRKTGNPGISKKNLPSNMRKINSIMRRIVQYTETV